jgi:hypothetical protein
VGDERRLPPVGEVGILREAQRRPGEGRDMGRLRHGGRRKWGTSVGESLEVGQRGTRW